MIANNNSSKMVWQFRESCNPMIEDDCYVSELGLDEVIEIQHCIGVPAKYRFLVHHHFHCATDPSVMTMRAVGCSSSLKQAKAIAAKYVRQVGCR